MILALQVFHETTTFTWKYFSQKIKKVRFWEDVYIKIRITVFIAFLEARETEIYFYITNNFDDIQWIEIKLHKEWKIFNIR